jgi:hypothetical protein
MVGAACAAAGSASATSSVPATAEKRKGITAL